MSSKPIVVAIISPNAEAQDVIVRALERMGNVETVWSVLAYPNPNQLKDLPRDPHGCIIFLDFSDRAAATAIAAEAHASNGTIQVVGMLDSSKDLNDLAALGIHEVLSLPPATHEVLRVLANLFNNVDEPAPSEPSDGRILAFLPAKPGAGATTLAVHTAAAAARLSGERTLLIDFDFRLGMTSFLLKLEGLYSALDALDECGRTEIRWDRLVNRRGKLDILGSAPQIFTDTGLERDAALVLDSARKTYKTIYVDLPGEMRDYEIDTLRRATECFLVCTPDIGVIHMAQRKSEYLRKLQLGTKTSAIMNRAGGMGFMSTRDVESILQLPVRFSVSNAEKQIAEATKTGTALGAGERSSRRSKTSPGVCWGRRSGPRTNPRPAGFWNSSPWEGSGAGRETGKRKGCGAHRRTG